MSTAKHVARRILWFLAVVTLGGALGLSCFRVAPIGDPGPPLPGDVSPAALSLSGFGMFACCIVAITALLGRASPRTRGTIALLAIVGWLALLALGLPDRSFGEVLFYATLWVSPAIFAALVLLADPKRARTRGAPVR